MAIALRGAAVEAEGTAVTSLTLPFHASWVAGDVALVACMHNRANEAMAEAAGQWDEIATDNASAFTESIFRRVLSGADIATGEVTLDSFSGGVGDNVYARGFAWSGVNSGTPQAAATTAVNSNNNATPTATDIGAIDAIDMAVAIAFEEGNSLAASTGGWTDLGLGTNAGGGLGIHFVTKIGASPGAYEWTMTSGRWDAFMAALNGASGGGVTSLGSGLNRGFDRGMDRGM